MLVKEKEHYLKDGLYYVDKNKVYISNDRRQNNLFEKKYFNGVQSIKVLLKKQLRSFFRVDKLYISSKEKVFKGNLLLVTRNNNIKIFDYHNSKVLTIFSDNNSFKKHLDTNKTFYFWFNLVKILEINYVDKVIIEEFIVNTSSEHWNESQEDAVVKEIFKSYKNYYLDYTRKNKSKSVEIVPPLNKKLEYHNTISDSFVKVPCHGDICFKNILFNDLNNIFFIDWEHSGDYLFYYDLINWMFVEAMDNKNYQYLNDFAFGKYDYYFETIFNLFNIQYKQNMKTDYLKAYIMERYLNRDICKGTLERKYKLQKYLHILHNFKDKVNNYG